MGQHIITDEKRATLKNIHPKTLLDKGEEKRMQSEWKGAHEEPMIWN